MPGTVSSTTVTSTVADTINRDPALRRGVTGHCSLIEVGCWIVAGTRDHHRIRLSESLDHDSDHDSQADSESWAGPPRRQPEPRLSAEPGTVAPSRMFKLRGNGSGPSRSRSRLPPPSIQVVTVLSGCQR